MPRKKFIIIFFLILVGFQISAFSDQEKQPDRTGYKNIALGKSYTLDPAPNYALCTDPDDLKQLTDGIYTQGYFWTQKSTVGWGGRSATITIDLGEIKPIKGVSYNTAAGVADVEWPKNIFILVSDDGKKFFEVGELVNLSREHDKPIDGKYGVHRFWTDKLSAHGRYVSLIIFGQPYIFVDEIEVYEGESSWQEQPQKGRVVAELKSFIPQKRTHLGVANRLNHDIDDLRILLKTKPFSMPVKQRIEDQLKAVEKEVLQTL